MYTYAHYYVSCTLVSIYVRRILFSLLSFFASLPLLDYGKKYNRCNWSMTYMRENHLKPSSGKITSMITTCRTSLFIVQGILVWSLNRRYPFLLRREFSLRVSNKGYIITFLEEEGPSLCASNRGYTRFWRKGPPLQVLTWEVYSCCETRGYLCTFERN